MENIGTKLNILHKNGWSDEMIVQYSRLSGLDIFEVIDRIILYLILKRKVK